VHGERKLKSFKIDDACIPINKVCNHIFNEITDKYDNKQTNEETPFFIFVLKSYFKHIDLINEYFQNILSSEPM